MVRVDLIFRNRLPLTAKIRVTVGPLSSVHWRSWFPFEMPVSVDFPILHFYLHIVQRILSSSTLNGYRIQILWGSFRFLSHWEIFIRFWLSGSYRFKQAISL